MGKKGIHDYREKDWSIQLFLSVNKCISRMLQVHHIKGKAKNHIVLIVSSKKFTGLKL